MFASIWCSAWEWLKHVLMRWRASERASEQERGEWAQEIIKWVKISYNSINLVVCWQLFHLCEQHKVEFVFFSFFFRLLKRRAEKVAYNQRWARLFAHYTTRTRILTIWRMSFASHTMFSRLEMCVVPTQMIFQLTVFLFSGKNRHYGKLDDVQF